MPGSLSYPDVYIEELYIGIHTISGVSTSIAEFNGWVTPGQMDKAIFIESFELALLPKTTNIDINLLGRAKIFHLLCMSSEPIQTEAKCIQDCCDGKIAFYIVDSPQFSTTSGLDGSNTADTGGGAAIGTHAANNAYYFPCIQVTDPLAAKGPILFPSCGLMLNLMAKLTLKFGVCKACAGIVAWR